MLKKMSTFLTVIREVDPNNSHDVKFDTTCANPRITYHFSLQIKVISLKKIIFQTIGDEGDSTCVTLMACWKDIGSLELAPSLTLLTTFDGHLHRPHGIVPNFLIGFGGMFINVEVEVADTKLDYNQWLEQN